MRRACCAAALRQTRIEQLYSRHAQKTKDKYKKAIGNKKITKGEKSETIKKEIREARVESSLEDSV
jgi:hypothetical protein